MRENTREKKRKYNPKSGFQKGNIPINRGKRNRIKKICKCGKIFEVYPYREKTALYCSNKCQRKYRYKPKTGKSISNSLSKMGKRNPMYGNFKEIPTKSALHEYVRKYKDKSDRCEHCGKIGYIELANIKNHDYTRNLDDYIWLCPKCHMIFDGREKYLALGRKMRIKNYEKI